MEHKRTHGNSGFDMEATIAHALGFDLDLPLGAIDWLLDRVADYRAITLPTCNDFSKLQSLFNMASKALTKIGYALPPLEEAGLLVMDIRYEMSPGFSRPIQETRHVSYQSDESHVRWRERVHKIRSYIQEEATEKPTGPIASCDLTIPMTLKRAAKLLGYARHRDEKGAVKLLSKSIKDGGIRAKKLTRQQWVFDRNEFPKESLSQIIPEGKK